MVGEIEALRYNEAVELPKLKASLVRLISKRAYDLLLSVYEAVELPKFKASLDRLISKKAYDLLLSVHSISSEDLSQFVEKATSEGNAILIQRGGNGYMVVVWKD